MTTTLKSFKLPLAIAAIGILTLAAHAQSFLTNGLPAPVGVGAISNISYSGGGNGNNIAVDSYNSHDTNYSVNGQYSPTMAKSNGNMASVSGFVILAGQGIDGNMYLGPTATTSSTNNVTGVVYYNSNIQFPDVTLPPDASSWTMAATTSVNVTIIVNRNPQTNTITAYDFTTTGNYIVNQDLPIIVEAGVKVNLNVTSTTYGGGIIIYGGITNAGTAKLYFNGPTSITFSGNTGINTNSRPENLWLIGLPSLTSINITTIVGVTGVIYAPEANLVLNGGGSGYGIAGSVIVNSLHEIGHYNVHFDESLASINAWIVSQPGNQTVLLGSNVTFSVTAAGAAPLWYQWFYNQTNLVAEGTNYSSLTLTNVQVSDAGFYSVVVSNAFGSMTSSNALLTVNLPVSPTITAQPTDLTVMIGSPAAFSVTADGTAPLSYQWQLNLTNILNATNAVCTIPAAAVTDGGIYSVVVTNVAGSVTSSNALLTVNVPPAVSLQFLDGSPVLNVSGMLNSNFVVQYNTDLTSTNWVDLTSITNLTSSPYQFIDPDGMDQQARFYRVIMR